MDRGGYDRSIAILQQAVERARIGDRDKLEAIRRLSRLAAPGSNPGPAGAPPEGHTA